MRRSLFLVLAVAAALAPAPPLEAESSLALPNLAGDWAGRGAGPGSQTYTLALRLYPDGSARLRRIGARDGEGYVCDAMLLPMSEVGHFRESVLSGPCVTGGAVRIEPEARMLAFRWSGADGEGDATGWLVRGGAKP